jgi:hypothetical protein
MSAPPVSLVKLSFSVAFVISAFALVAFAVYVLRLRCEGFGCTGIGIAWAAWATAYVPVLAMGAVLRSVLPETTRLRIAVSWSLLVLLAGGAALALYWLVSRAAQT